MNYDGELILIGIRANRGKNKAYARWQPTIDYLTASIPGYHFNLNGHSPNSSTRMMRLLNKFQKPCSI